MGEHRYSHQAGAVVAATALAYGVLANLMWEIDPTWGSAFWPAAGVTFAAAVRSPVRRWPALALAIGGVELLTNLVHGMSLFTATWGGVANAVEPCLGAAIFRLVGRQRRLTGLPALAWLLAGGVLLGPLVGAVFGGLFAVGGPTPALERLVRWWVGDAVGVLAVAPVLLPVRRSGPPRSRVELTLVVAATIATAGLLLAPRGGQLDEATPFVAVPVLLWTALRFGVAGAAAGATVLAGSVHAATATGHGPFAALDSGLRLTVAQVFIGTMCLSALTVAILVEDLVARRRSEMDLLHRATHDPLTGLGNRALLDQRLRDGDVGAVAVIDLDGFKAVNDRHGHAAGDALLVEVARRLRTACRAGDLLVRIGGDEFVLVMPGIVPGEEADAVDGRLRRTLATPVAVGDAWVPIGASIGWALADERDDGAAAMIAVADAAMYAAKREQRDDPVSRS